MTRDNLVERASCLLWSRFDRKPNAVGVAPGRVELLGNHTDYNEGWVLTAAVDYSTAVAVSLRDDNQVRVVSEHPDYSPARFLADTPAKMSGDERWANYVQAVVAEFAADGISLPGADIAICSDVPDGSGVSSSAALLVATGVVLEALLAPQRWNPMAMAQLCRRAENGPLVGAPVGLLDQFSSRCGQSGYALKLDCRTLDFEAVPFPSDACAITIANTRVRHALAEGGGYRDRRDACFRVARSLTGRGDASLRDVTVEQLESVEPTRDPADVRRARHVLAENRRVLEGSEALRQRDWMRFGQAMSESHASCVQLFENSCAEVDLLVRAAMDAGAYGAKLTGGGWGGSAVIVHAPECAAQIQRALEDSWQAHFAGTPLLLPTSAAQGAEVFVR